MQKKELQDLYVKLEPIQHIYKLPDTYIGSVEPTQAQWYLFDHDTKTMKLSTVEYVPGLYKLVDELAVNAIDQWRRLRSDATLAQVKNVRMSLDRDTGVFCMYNDGEGIDIAQHPEHQTWIPHMIFGQLLTSTNYDGDEEKVVGGKNGLGAKLVNVFSKWFELETVDRVRKLKYTQRFENNMNVTHDPIVKKTAVTPYTQVTFAPDFQRFGMTGWTHDFFKILEKRAYELSACMTGVNVFFNGNKIDCRSFEKFMDFFPETLDGKVFERFGDRWEVGIAPSEEGFQQISYVNGICTLRGGKHVEYVTNQICKKIVEFIEKKKKIKVKNSYIRENMMIFLNCLISNPSFDSQTKETLTTQATKFGSKCEITDSFLNKLTKSGMIEKVLTMYDFKQQCKSSQDSSKRRGKILGIDKLEEANEAGGPDALKCTLILTEGDSAKGTAVAGIEVVGRDLWGVFPLKGKMINARDKFTTLQGKKQLSENKELINLQTILGLTFPAPDEVGKTYRDLSGLRYGRVMLMTDQDVDGSHIKGLFINWVDTFWPELIEMGFISCIVTPIIKIRKGKTQEISFYSIGDYLTWKTANDIKGWEVKYYKGLGTSDNKEAKQYFANLKEIRFLSDAPSREKMDMAFNKTRAQDRKDWLGEYDIDKTLDINLDQVSLGNFVDLDLKHFSNYDLHRSIGHVMDGLKPSQRKILFACFKRNLVKEIKVAQLAGYVSEHTGYHHGEESLNKAIVGMAQDFVGSNNVNLLMPNGQFGTRLEGGKDHASSRYIFTCLSPLVKHLFPEDDFPLLDYINDDGTPVEPRFYVPILPSVLLNGNCGVGTGYSTDIPCFNPREVATQFLQRLKDPGSPFVRLTPFYRDFRGTIHETTEMAFVTKGIYRIATYKTVEITELPIGTWTNDYKTFLETLVIENKAIEVPAGKCLTNFRNYCTESRIHFVLEFVPEILKTWTREVGLGGDGSGAGKMNGIDTFERNLRLTSKLSLTNMHLFGTNEIIAKFRDTTQVMECFFRVRHEFYVRRKQYLLDRLQKDVTMLQNKVRFVLAIVEEKISVHKKTKADLIGLLEELSFDRYESSTSPTLTYDYLINMPIHSLSMDNVESLKGKLQAKMDLFDALQKKSIESIWAEEITGFIVAYDTMMAKRDEEERESISAISLKTATGKKKPRAAKKAIVAK